jgi:hypothetical protein
MKTEAEFEKFYQSRLQGDLYELENRRQSLTGKIRIVLLSEVVVFAGICIYFFLLRPENPDSFLGSGPARFFWIILALVFCIIIFVFSAIWLSKKFRGDFKEKIIRPILGQIGNEIVYSPADKIGISDFRNSGIFKGNITNYAGRDLIESKIGDVSYRFSWLNVASKKYVSTYYNSKVGMTGSATRTETNRLFEGIFYVADFGSLFPTEAIVWSNVLEKYKWGTTGNFLQDSIMGKRIILEDPVFEKGFAVYGSDEVAIRQMLTPGLRQWMADFRAKTDSLLFLSFKGSKMNIAAYMQKQLFEARIFRKVDDYNFILEYYRYLSLFTGILEEISKRH